ncbi:MAG TPA: hypothetical protein DCX68_11695 [Marinobacter hydrocarbonoclasticus]|nr:hypothetical protein [Marinobacter nauticus]
MGCRHPLSLPRSSSLGGPSS